MAEKWTGGRSIAEHGLSDKKFTLVVGDREYPRRVALPVMGGVLLVMGGFFAGVLWLVYAGK
ncbi:hypothetical protein J7E95_35295 [Streptomyces sp. ISL-14]|nr:hypothetical protein [Streptomyces sp. ISL-14]